MLELNKIYLGDCLDLMPRIADNSVDMILCDLPYGTTSCKWDVIIPFDKLWEQYKRICKPNAAIVLFGSEPFSTMLRMSNLKDWRYDWVWVKTKAGNFQICKVQPLKLHEIISVFYRKMPTYNNTELKPCHIKSGREHKGKHITVVKGDPNYIQEKTGYNKSVLYYSNPSGAGHLHPTQKPVELLQYLIRTYTNENDVVLDNTMGSGSTIVAAIKENRQYIGIEKDEHYFEIANERIAAETSQLSLFNI